METKTIYKENLDKEEKIIAINSQRMAGWLMFNRFNKLGEEVDRRSVS